MPANKDLQIIQDTFLLYELSLAVGGSLDPLENSRRFLQVLVNRKGLTYGAVWIRDAGSARLFCATPDRELVQTVIADDHFIWRQLAQRPFFSLSTGDAHFQDLVQERHIVQGAFAVFGLGDLGFLKIFSAGRTASFSKMEMSQLEAVIHKFKVSMEGCLAHDRLMEESKRRLEIQQTLERTNERFLDLFENMNDALVIFDEEGNIVEANKAAKDLALIDRLPSPNLWHLVPPEEIENTRAAFHTLIEKGKKTGFETRIVIPGGQVKYIQVNSSGIFRNGRMVGSRNIIRDISRQKEAERALVESERRLRQIIDTSLDAVITIDREGKITEWNKQAEQIFGYAKTEVLDQALGDWIVPPTYRRDHKRMMNILKHRERPPLLNKRIEMKALHRQGFEFPIELSVSSFSLGDQLFFNAFVRDISERKAAEEAIRSNQVRMGELIRNLQSGILLENEKREIALVNQFFCDIFGIPAPPAALIGQDCSHSAEQSKGLFKDPEGFVRGIEERLRNQILVVGEELYMADGRILERDYIPLRSDGRYLGHLWQYRDLTEKRQAAEAIRKSEEKYRGIIENMELGLLEVDVEGRVVRAYDRFCDMTGYEAAELIGKNAAEILIPEEQRYIVEQQSADRLQGKAGIYEIQLRKKDGSLIWVLISGAPLIDADGKFAGSLGIHYDITKRKELERELAEAKQQAEQARLAEQQFLANMSHEIRTPMNAVIGMTHLLYETPIDHQQKEYLDALRFSADTLLGIINNILDLSKIEAGELEIEEKPFNLRQLVQSLQRTFQFKLREKPVSVVLDYDEQIRHFVIADPIRLNQVLTNLMGNASKFTFSGTVGLRVRCMEQTEQNYRLRFEVHDTGIGIPADKIDAIFHNFKQADVKVTRKFGGTGLGLAIVKQLVELMGGRIEVSSREGAGSTFRVELNLKKSEAEAVERDLPNDQMAPEEKQILEQLKVLVVEDNSMNQRLMANILEIWGSAYVLAADGRTAIQHTAGQLFDLILMDIHMPGMDGYETTRRIRSDPQNPNRHSLIIALTAAALLDEKKKALEAGMNDYLTKPFSPERLRSLILHKMGFRASERKWVKGGTLPGQTHRIGIDLSYLFELSGGDPFFVRDMVETFLRETPESLNYMMNQLETEDWDALYRTVHSLKPNFMMLGMRTQEDLAARIEQKLKSDSIDHERLHAQLEQLADDTRKAFPQLEKALRSI